jgi:hypothetical protein
MKKILAVNLAIVFVVAGFFCGLNIKLAKAALSTNASANAVIGQPDMVSNSDNQGGSVDLNKLYMPRAPFFDGNKFFVVDAYNNRVLIYNSIPSSNNANADVVIGQSNMTSGGDNQGGPVAANTLSNPTAVFSDGARLILCDSGNNRVLIFNSIPTANNANADVVIGQANFTHNEDNQGGSVAANMLNLPTGLYFDGKKLFVSDWDNHRVLIFNSLPTSNNANADVVIGQQNMTSSSANQGVSVAANTLYYPNGVWANGSKLFIADQYNHRVLIFNSIPTANNANADVVIGQQNMTSNSENQGESVGANTMLYPTHLFPYGPKLLVLDSANSRLLVFNSIPTANNANADVAIGQVNLASGELNQGGASSAENTLHNPRGIFVADSKLMIGDYYNNRVLVYNSFGSQWTITKNHSQSLSGGEKMKVKKKSLEFSGKKTAYKKGYVRIYRNGVYVKKVKIKKSGKWSASFKDTGSASKYFVIKYYNKSNALQMNSETYAIGINRGNLGEATLEKAMVGSSIGYSPRARILKPKDNGPGADPSGR